MLTSLIGFYYRLPTAAGKEETDVTTMEEAYAPL
jgi:hypothetical protein